MKFFSMRIKMYEKNLHFYLEAFCCVFEQTCKKLVQKIS